jgi:hypothetical protein
MDIRFPEIEVMNTNLDSVSFPADVDGKQMRCAISLEALQDNFGGDSGDPVDCFRANRSAIESKAASLIRKGRVEKDGSILIRSSDGA